MENNDSNPLAGLDWTPTFHSVSVSQRKPSPPPSLSILSMEYVVNHPDLVEDICSFLPASMRKEMLAISLDKKLTDSTIPLFYTWTGPVLSLKSIFPTLNHNPELVGDLHNQVSYLLSYQVYQAF